MNNPRADHAFLTVLVILGVVRIKMAFIHASESVVLLLAVTTVFIITLLNKSAENEKHNQ